MKNCVSSLPLKITGAALIVSLSINTIADVIRNAVCKWSVLEEGQPLVVCRLNPEGLDCDEQTPTGTICKYVLAERKCMAGGTQDCDNGPNGNCAYVREQVAYTCQFTKGYATEQGRCSCLSSRW